RGGRRRHHHAGLLGRLLAAAAAAEAPARDRLGRSGAGGRARRDPGGEDAGRSRRRRQRPRLPRRAAGEVASGEDLLEGVIMIGKRGLLAGAAGVLLAGGANAQPKYPSEPIKLVVPRAPGGGSDILARLIQPALEKKLGQTVIVDNRPDAAAVMGAAIVTKAKPDGYTLLLTDNSFYQNPAILDSLPYDTLHGFTAITLLSPAPVPVVVYADVTARTLGELIERAKKTRLTFASGGVGSSTHLMGVMVNLKAGIDITHVPFKSSGQALIALLGGHVSMQYGGLASAPP